MTALALLERLRPSLGHEMIAAHVDHGHRAGTELHRDDAATFAAWLGVGFVERRLALAPGADFESRARRARYTALVEMARAQGCTHVATAHTADDQAETLLLRLLRGAGPDALAGIRVRRDDLALPLVRPLLLTRRADLAAIAALLAVPYRDDPTNEDQGPSRNRLRHQVIPALEAAFPGATAGLARSAHAAALRADLWPRRCDLSLIVERDAATGELTVRAPCVAFAGGLGAAAGVLREAALRLGAPMPSQRAAASLHRIAAATAVTPSEGAAAGLRFVREGDTIRIVATRSGPPNAV